MSEYRDDLPQLASNLYLTDAGIETDLIFNRGIEIREFAAHTVSPDEKGREVLANYRCACSISACRNGKSSHSESRRRIAKHQ
jgi:hypothetical protein